MSDTNTEIDSSTLVAPPVADDPSKGSAQRFDTMMATNAATVREGSPEDKNITDANDVLKQPKADAAPVKSKEDKPKVDAPKPDDVPDFTKKREPAKVEEPNYDEELKAHPAIKGEASKSFKKVLAERDAAKKQAAEYEAKLKAAEARTGNAPSAEQEARLADLQKKLAEREEEIGRINYERSPRIQGIIKQENDELTAAKSYLDGDEAKQYAVEMAAMAQGKKRLNILVDSGMTTEEIAAVSANLTRVDQCRRERSSEVENWRTQSAEQEAQDKQRTLAREAQQRELEKAVFKNRFEKLSPDLEAYSKVEGYDGWNRGSEEHQQQAERFFNGEASLDELADIVIKGVAYDRKNKLMANLQAKHEAVLEELARLKAATPPNGEVRNADPKPGEEGGTMASRFDAVVGARRG